MDRNNSPKISLPMDKFCEVYNDVPGILSAYAVTVNLNADTYRRVIEEILYEKENNGNYWIISLADSNNSAWLVPNPLRNVNFASFKSLSFTFDSDKQGNFKQPTSFTLLEPAQVIALPSEPITWKLVKRGLINFFLDKDAQQSNENLQVTSGSIPVMRQVQLYDAIKRMLSQNKEILYG